MTLRYTILTALAALIASPALAQNSPPQGGAPAQAAAADKQKAASAASNAAKKPKQSKARPAYNINDGAGAVGAFAGGARDMRADRP